MPNRPLLGLPMSHGVPELIKGNKVSTLLVELNPIYITCQVCKVFYDGFL